MFCAACKEHLTANFLMDDLQVECKGGEKKLCILHILGNRKRGT